ncbi:MAG TPA: DUF5695 domain-containing protein [Candidatus Solibacter sp.]|nr:DUF5695 domain-containing protein [Candidatus Solibacter sp.]
MSVRAYADGIPKGSSPPVNGNLSRRLLLKSMGTAGLAAMVPDIAANGTSTCPSSPDTSRTTAKSDLVRLSSSRMVATFDRRIGTLYSITEAHDALGTNFLGNSDNTLGIANHDTHWTGDVVTTIWELKTAEWIREQESFAPYRVSGKWKRESTLASSDIREVAFDGKVFTVKYAARSKSEDGIQSYALSMRYRFANDGSLVWDVEFENSTNRTLEFGELAFPLRANDDYAAPYEGATTTLANIGGKLAEMQKTIHEQKVLCHSFVAGHSSYALLQRPRGDAPFLLFHCLQDTAFECIYKTPAQGDDWIGTDLFAVHSNAAKDLRGWHWNPWVNGHSSLVLEPGARKSYQMRFVFLDSYSDITKELTAAGNLGIRAVPSMVVQEDTDAYVELSCMKDLEALEIHSDGIAVKERKRTDQSTLLTLSFHGRGQKSLRLVYNGKRWTNLHFFCVEDAEQLLKARSRFMVERQFVESPDDAYHRHHMFLPFDYRRATRLDDNEDVWEVGGTDDPGFGDPIFLVAKNSVLPSRDEIEKLEMFVSDCLFKYIQNPETYEIRASLYWKVRTPSSPWGNWSRKRSEATWRTYNYAFVTNIYHGMYRIGREYDILAHRGALDYLRLCYETCRKWFTTGPYKHFGLITGLNAVNIVEDLKSEGWQKEYETILGLMRKTNQVFLTDPYPYSSEIQIDETAQSQVYFFTRYFGKTHGEAESWKRNTEVRQVLQAMRGGDQPIWFLYGNDLFAHPDLRGQISCWHSEALNGMALMQAFEDTGNFSLLLKGYAGMMSVLHNVLPDGMGFGWFKLDPGVFACEPPRTFEGGSGLWAFIQAAKSYVVNDPTFGWIGYGCRVENDANQVRVFPKDGVRRRVLMVPDRIHVTLRRGELKCLTFDRRTSGLNLQIEDTTGIVRTVPVRIEGLEPGEYLVRMENSELRVRASGKLEFEVPVEDARSLQILKVH